ANDQIVKPDGVSGLRRASDQKKTKKTDRKVGYVVLNGKKKKAPELKFIDQDGDTITNRDYKGKVYVVEFFYTTCPTICPIMNDNLVEVSKVFKGNKKFGIA